jgi:hypothetical protein
MFGLTTPFGADTAAISGAGAQYGGSAGSIFSTLGNPGGTINDFNGFPGAYGDAPIDAFGSVPGVSSPMSASPVSAAGAGVPAGVSPAVAPDPTQQQQGGGAGLPQGGGTGGFSLESLLTGAGKSLAANPLGILAGGAGLATSMFQGQQRPEGFEQLQAQAAQLNEQGRAMASYLQSGNLPPGLKMGLDEATSAAKARVIQNFANQGMATDPTKNSALAAQLAAIDQRAIIATAQIGQQLLGSGIQQSGMASSLYNTLAQIDQTQTQRIGQSIANFAAALSPSRGLTRAAGK